MRESIEAAKARAEREKREKADARPMDERRFFESYYRATLEDGIEDWETIGSTATEIEARFHYNAAENSILKALSPHEPPPAPAMARAWKALRARREAPGLDIGSGAGHWIVFQRRILGASSVVGVEFVPEVASRLRERFAVADEIEVLEADIADDGFPDLVGRGRFHYVTAIGVLFHIIDDDRWRKALGNLAAVLAPDGFLFCGGEFGETTEDRETVRTDRFEEWSEYSDEEPSGPRVLKRVRSLADWRAALEQAGLVEDTLERSDRSDHLTTPENDILLARPLGAAETP